MTDLADESEGDFVLTGDPRATREPVAWSLYRHRRYDGSDAHTWLRGRVVEVAEVLERHGVVAEAWTGHAAQPTRSSGGSVATSGCSSSRHR
ncbi:hypothetical protein [Burkholderia sp. BCC1993]|uniref:hypothetical protein n=1 Tax=Burkholderia sp. BCC1993 TaxID=2817444 RepID=UPI002AB2D658|nr:hypothetical protein [Burkholderia sp. BCC1993]